MSKVRSWAGSRSPRLPTGGVSYEAADRALNEAYRNCLTAYGEQFGPKAVPSPDLQATYADHVSEHKRRLVAAQRAWVRYRDAWAKLVASRLPPANAASAASTVKAALTEERTLEIVAHPVGGR